jgi:hypothetical protein
MPSLQLGSWAAVLQELVLQHPSLCFPKPHQEKGKKERKEKHRQDTNSMKRRLKEFKRIATNCVPEVQVVWYFIHLYSLKNNSFVSHLIICKTQAIKAQINTRQKTKTKKFTKF